MTVKDVEESCCNLFKAVSQQRRPSIHGRTADPGSRIKDLFSRIRKINHPITKFGELVNKGYWTNRPSQQLFKVFIYIYFAATCLGPRWPSSGGIHNYFREVTSLQRIRCLSYSVYGLANTAVVCLICGNVKTLKCYDIRI
jgi:hypothetical protein